MSDLENDGDHRDSAKDIPLEPDDGCQVMSRQEEPLQAENEDEVGDKEMTQDNSQSDSLRSESWEMVNVDSDKSSSNDNLDEPFHMVSNSNCNPFMGLKTSSNDS